MIERSQCAKSAVTRVTGDAVSGDQLDFAVRPHLADSVVVSIGNKNGAKRVQANRRRMIQRGRDRRPAVTLVSWLSLAGYCPQNALSGQFANQVVQLIGEY